MSFLSSCPLSLVVKAPWHWWRNPILLLLLLPLKRFGGSSFWFFLQCQKSSCLACQRPPIHHQGMSNYSVLVPCYWIEYIYCASLFLSSMALEVMMIVAKSSSIFWLNKKIPLNRVWSAKISPGIVSSTRYIWGRIMWNWLSEPKYFDTLNKKLKVNLKFQFFYLLPKHIRSESQLKMVRVWTFVLTRCYFELFHFQEIY